MPFLRLLENIRFPAMDQIMMGITYLGDETAFLVISLIVFWCVNKRLGYYVMSVGFIGTIANQFLKLIFCIPRPWVLDNDFQIVEAARASATGYSFPSGHTQNAVGTFGSLACVSKNKWIKGILIALAVLIPFSRMYLGVHTPWDVGAAALMALVLVFVMKPLILDDENGNRMKKLLPVMAILAAVFLMFTQLFPFSGDVDPDNLASGQKNALSLMGAIIGFAVVYVLDEKYFHFSTRAVWWAQILKVIDGLIFVLAVKTTLKAPLTWLLGADLQRVVRYFLVVIAAGIVWPLTFRWFSKLGLKAERG